MADEATNEQPGDSGEAPGWDAINAALAPLYGDQEPRHYGTALPAMFGGNDPLQGISIYESDVESPHWHYVTYGFSELYAKETEDPDVSGYGFELTFRLPRNPKANDDPPVWPLNFLQNIARYVFKTGNCFAAHHHVNLNGPIALNEPTEIVAICFEADPQLGSISTPNGAVDFLQVVGLCDDEYQLAKRSSSAVVLAALAKGSPLLITRLDRPSLLADPKMKTDLEAAAAAAGSSQNEFYATLAETKQDGDKLSFRLAANAVEDFLAMVRLRIGAGKSFVVIGKGTALVFAPGEETKWSAEEEGFVTIDVSPTLQLELMNTVVVKRGVYRFDSCPNFTLEVVPTEIKDGEGKKVVRVVG